MNTVVIPIKGLHAAKSRLAPALDEAERARLVLVLAERVVCAAAAARGVDRVLVVSKDERILELAGALGAVGVRERGGVAEADALNAALEDGRRGAHELGSTRIAVVVADLPTVEPEDVAAVFDALAAGADVVLARARDGEGLGALGLRSVDALPFRFGDGRAFRHHAAAAQQLGLSAVVLDRPGLAIDVDTADDLAACRASLPMGWERIRIDQPRGGVGASAR